MVKRGQMTPSSRQWRVNLVPGVPPTLIGSSLANHFKGGHMNISPSSVLPTPMHLSLLFF